jgi:hypothetical protein
MKKFAQMKMDNKQRTDKAHKVHLIKVIIILITSFVLFELSLRLFFAPGLQIHKIFQKDEYRMVKLVPKIKVSAALSATATRFDKPSKNTY